MPFATLCPKCTYRWTLAEASPRSWKCPSCGTSCSGEAKQTRCECTHPYNDHDIHRDVGNSLSAMTLRGSEITPERLDAMPLAQPPSDPPIGRCNACPCVDYKPAQ